MLDVIQDQAVHLWDNYLWALSLGDKRTQGWFLMGSYWPTWALTFAYLFCVWIGPKLMRNREPFQLKGFLVVYNFILVAVNFHIFFELFYCTTKLRYSYSCQEVHYGDDPDELRIAKAMWWYYFSKCIEFLDTMFFILRKKNNQISFLHVYHHASMFPIWWTGVMWVAGGQAFFGAMLNSFIHILMYSYYGVAALGPQYQKYLWWKKYLTTIQLVQFVLGMIHAAQSLWVQCPFPLWMQYALIVYGTSILLLFINFYFHAYIKPKKDRSIKSTANGKAANGKANGNPVLNGHTTNGVVTRSNGARMEGKKKK